MNSNGDGKNRYPHRLLQLWWVLGMGKSPLLEFYCSIENREEAIEMESQGITKGHPFGCPLTHPHWGYSFGELFYRHPHSSPLEFTEPTKRGCRSSLLIVLGISRSNCLCGHALRHIELWLLSSWSRHQSEKDVLSLLLRCISQIR